MFMCVAKVKEKLKEYVWINKNIEQLENELLVIESRVMKVTTTLSDLPRMQGHNDTLADNVSDMIEIQNAINRKLPELYKVRLEIENMIDKLSEIEQHLIRARYIEDKHWEVICVEMVYSWSQIHCIHSNILKKISNESPD